MLLYTYYTLKGPKTREVMNFIGNIIQNSAELHKIKIPIEFIFTYRILMSELCRIVCYGYIGVPHM